MLRYATIVLMLFVLVDNSLAGQACRHTYGMNRPLSDHHKSSCELCEGKATGYFHNVCDRLISMVGDVWIYFYDGDDTFLGSATEFVEYKVYPNETQKIAQSNAPEKAIKCRFEVDEELLSYKPIEVGSDTTDKGSK